MNERSRSPEEQQESGTEKAGAQGFDRDRADTYYERVRPAGPQDMRDPPEGAWDIVDEGSDESFPASDPPSYMGGTGVAAPPAAGSDHSRLAAGSSDRKTEGASRRTDSGPDK